MTEISAIIARCRGRIEHTRAKLASIDSELLRMVDILPLLQRIDEAYDEFDKMMKDKTMKDDVTPEQEEKIKRTLSAVEQMLDFLDSAAEMLAKMSGMLTSLAQSYQ